MSTVATRVFSCMVPLRSVVTLFALSVMFAGGMGCETQPTHEVLTLTDISPRQVEPGDRIELTGTGFPLAADIRRITVRLSGTLSRPGLPSCPRSVQFTLSDPPPGEGVTDPVTGSERPATYAESATHRITLDAGGSIAFVAGEDLVRGLTSCPGERFAPGPDAVPHATVSLTGLRGGITVLIETAQGTLLAAPRALRGPVLELHPPAVHRLAAELEARAQAERALDVMGLRLTPVQPPEGGLQVERVRPGSSADEAGIADGDILERIDGATLLDVADLRPAPGATQSVLSVRRGDALDERVVRVEGLTQGVPMDLVATGVLLAVALAVVALLLVPSAALAAWPSRTVRNSPGKSAASWASVTAGTVRQGWAPFLRALTDSFSGPDVLWRPLSPHAVLGLAALATTLAAAPLGPTLLAAGSEVDIGIVHAVAVAVLCLVAVTAAGRGSFRRPLRTTLGALGTVAAFQVPAAAALGGAVVSAGSLRLQGLVDAQGGEPWTWTVFRSPVALCLTGVYIVGAALPIEALTGNIASATVAETVGNPRRRTLWRAARGAATYVQCAVAAAVFLGAWRLPGVDRAVQDATPALQMLGAAALAAKAWGVLYSVRSLRAALGRARGVPSATLGWRYLLPVGAVGLFLMAGAESLAARVPARAGEVAAQVAGWTTFLVCAVFALGVVRQGRIGPERATGWEPDPFG